MNISLLTLFPSLYTPFLQTSLLKHAQEKKIISFDVTSLFDYSPPKQRIDAPAFGPGAGMVIKPDIIEKAINEKQKKYGNAFKIFFSPQGKKINQKTLQTLQAKLHTYDHLLLLASRYEGIDERVEQQYADEVLSVGDFVVMGGDVPAMLFLEGFLRLIPGVVGKQESVAYESFSGPFLDWPVYTEPVEWHGKKVPDIIRSGNHGKIKEWRLNKAAEKTVKTHFDWLRAFDLDKEEKGRAKKYIPQHYIALIHSDVRLAHDRIGNTSVTSIDIHDIARSAKTYDLAKYWIVTALQDQQKVVKKMLSFWQSDVGISYNPQRHKAIDLVETSASLQEVIKNIEEKEGKKPLLIATSAQHVGSTEKHITFVDQEKVWAYNRPILFLFGTGQGLSEDQIDTCDYILPPITGFSDFNHLSVRSAVGIVFDRWLGINPQEES